MDDYRGWSKAKLIERLASLEQYSLHSQALSERDRIVAEAAQRDSEERLRNFGRASLDVLWMRDSETLQWTYLTPAFETIYGLDRDAALVRFRDRHPCVDAGHCVRRLDP